MSSQFISRDLTYSFKNRPDWQELDGSEKGIDCWRQKQFPVQTKKGPSLPVCCWQMSNWAREKLLKRDWEQSPLATRNWGRLKTIVRIQMFFSGSSQKRSWRTEIKKKFASSVLNLEEVDWNLFFFEIGAEFDYTDLHFRCLTKLWPTDFHE